jgi:YHS domain-containing protein
MRYVLLTAFATSLMLLIGNGDFQAARGAASTEAKALYGGQKTCPVTGDSLDSMGTPIPVKVKGQTIYVCCKSCVAKVQRNPDKYVAKVMAERGSR